MRIHFCLTVPILAFTTLFASCKAVASRPAAPEADAAKPQIAATEVVLTLSASTVAPRTTVYLRASANARGTLVTKGMVEFCDAAAPHCEDTALLGTIPLTHGGSATVRLKPAIGEHSYKAIFVGTKTHSGSVSATETLIVTGPVPTTTALSLGGAPGDYSLTATVTVGGTGMFSPAGEVSFVDETPGGPSLPSVSLATAVRKVTVVPVGSPIVPVGPLGLTGYESGLAEGDCDEDGNPDLAVLTPNLSNFGDADGSVSILLGKSDGRFVVYGPPVATGFPRVAGA